MTMKFQLERVGRGGERAGVLKLGSSTATPFPLLVTRGGLVPHLTRETLQKLPWAEGALLAAPVQHHVLQVKIEDSV